MLTKRRQLLVRSLCQYLESPPSKNGTIATDGYLTEGKEFYVVEYADQKSPGGFGTPNPVNSIKEVREKLAVLKSWKDEDVDEIVIRKYKVKEGEKVQVRQSIIGPQTEISGPNKGEVYAGGDEQYNFFMRWGVAEESPNSWKKYFELLSEKKLK